MTEQLKTVEEKYEDLKVTMLCTFDEAYGNGMSPEDMLSEMKTFVSTTELGQMDAFVDTIFEEWKADRDL